jgi:hypothetical protein
MTRGRAEGRARVGSGDGGTGDNGDIIMKERRNLALSDYVEAVGESSKRSRSIAIVITVASILCFIAFWNSTQWSWGRNRVSQYEDALKYWPLDKTTDELMELKGNTYEDYEGAKSFMKRQGYDPDDMGRQGLSKKEIQVISDNVRAIVRAKYSALQDQRIDNVINVRIPFFGIFFDVNDLGLFGGITFLAMLLMFRYSLLREYENIKIFAGQAGTETDLYPYYALMATQQVLTVPPGRPGEGVFWRKLPRLVLWAPVLILLVILVNDGATFSIGSEVSVSHTISSFAMTGLLLAFNTILAFNCTRYWRYLDVEWNNLFSRIIDSSATFRVGT